MFYGCLSGWNPISRADLHEMVRMSIANEPKERERPRKAVSEFNERSNSVSDVKSRVKIMKDVASKYGYREEYFMEKINL